MKNFPGNTQTSLKMIKDVLGRYFVVSDEDASWFLTNICSGSLASDFDEKAALIINILAKNFQDPIKRAHFNKISSLRNCSSEKDQLKQAFWRLCETTKLLRDGLMADGFTKIRLKKLISSANESQVYEKSNLLKSAGRKSATSIKGYLAEIQFLVSDFDFKGFKLNLGLKVSIRSDKTKNNQVSMNAARFAVLFFDLCHVQEYISERTLDETEANNIFYHPSANELLSLDLKSSFKQE